MHAFAQMPIEELQAANDALLLKLSQLLVTELSESEQQMLEQINAQQKLAQAYLTLRQSAPVTEN